MKKYILFLIVTTFALTVNAQNEFTGQGDGYSWSDPLNWSYGDIPDTGQDILIDGWSVITPGYFITYGTLELRGGALLFTENDILLSGDFIVDVPSTLQLFISDLNQFSKVVCQGNYYFNGTIDISFAGYVPQIGHSYPIIQGAQGSCGTPTTVFVLDQVSNGFEVTLGTLCQANNITYTVTDINYTTAIAWDGEGGDGQWQNPANWDPNGVPPSNSLLVFNLPGAGGYANTDLSGVTEAYNIKIGQNNTLAVNGDLLMTSSIYLSEGATLVWNGGKIYKSDPNIQSLILSDGEIVIDSPLLKELDNDMEIWVFKGDINHNQGDLNINNGKIILFNQNKYNINADGIDIGYTSGTTHELRLDIAAKLIKTAGNGTSTINLTDFRNEGDILSEVGTLIINGTLNPGPYSEYGGSGTIQFPTGFVIDGELSPGSSPGILTVMGDMTTSTSATFNIEIDGPSAGTEYDQIIVTNEAILEGSINITLGYLPANYASFEIVTAGTLTTCNFPSQITANYNGTDYTFNVACQNNVLYLNGPGATLTTSDFELNAVNTYPNPASDILNIATSYEIKGHWNLYNQLGQSVITGKLKSTETKINTSNLKSGFYALQIKDENSRTIVVKKILIN